MKKQKYLILAILPILLLGFLSVGSFAQLTDSIVTMYGKDWYIQVDSTLATAIDSKSSPYALEKDGGSQEVYVTLKSAKDCVKGKIDFKVDMSGLTIKKQLPLDKESDLSKYAFVNATHALDSKGNVLVYRPENVVNSFACFDSEGKKVLHIYASKLIDATGKTVWVDSDIKDGILTVILDTKFLETAVYPVTLDPTFGYTTVGASESFVGASYVIAGKFTLSEDADLTNIKAYINGEQTTNAKAVVYSDDSGTPDALLYTSDELSVGTSGYSWKTFTIDGILSAGDYWLGYGHQTSNIWYMYDSDGSSYSVSGFSYDAFPDPFGGSGGTQKLSIYATYDLAPTPTPTPTASPTPTSTPTPETSSYDSVLLWASVVLMAINVCLAFFPRIPLLNFGVGILSVLIAITNFGNTSLPFQPYFSLILFMVSVISFVSSVVSLRGDV